MPRLRSTVVALVVLWACGTDSPSDPTAVGTPSPDPPGSGSGPTGTGPTKIVFQHPADGFPEVQPGDFEDSVPVGPGLRYIVRAIPMDAADKVYSDSTFNWSVSGGGSLAHAVTSTVGGGDATLNAWTVGTQDGIESITVTLPAHPTVQGTLHVRVVHVRLSAINPPNSDTLTLRAGQQIPLTAQLQTASGQGFAWFVKFTALLWPYSPCGQHEELTGGLSATPGATPVVELTVPTDAQGKATVFYTAPTDAPSTCLGFVGAIPGASPGGIGGLNTQVFDLSWFAHLTPSPATRIVAVSGDGQAASPGATLGQSLVVEVQDQFGNGVPGVTVSWMTSSGLMSPPSAATDAGGRVSAKWTVGASAGNQTATASIPGGASVTFTVSVS
jgi:hypothetical protein